jgi:hypothetical protein
MRQRMASMPPDERQQMIERMRARGFTPPTDVPAAAATAKPAQAQQKPATAKAATARGVGATTIDALFGPLPPTESFGQVWLHENGKLNRVRLRLGISDGQQTELIQVLDNPKIDEGTEVVTAVTTAAQRTTTAATGNAFPGLGNQRGGFQGGFPGGGGGGGNRGAGGAPGGGR